MTVYPYVASYWDNYGPRERTLGLMLHMAEGSGTVGYLDKNGKIPPRGVSVHFVCELSGRMVRMLNLYDVSGSLNPNDRSTDKAYYGHSHLVDVLGDYWFNPNQAVISIEIEGFARTGPNAAQQKALVQWAADMVGQFPSIRGALGHADQTDTKGCPGTTPEMKAVFASIGGHGLWTPQEEPPPVLDFTYQLNQPDSGPGTVTVTIDGADAILADGSLYPLAKGIQKHSYGLVRFKDGNWKGQDAYLIGDDCGFLLKRAASYTSEPTEAVVLTIAGEQVYP